MTGRRVEERATMHSISCSRLERERIRALAVQWLRQHPAPAAKLRFDVACVLKGRLEVLEGAF